MRFAERQHFPRICELSAVPEPVPQLPPARLTRVRGPATGSTSNPGEEGSAGEIRQRVERATEALQAIVLRLQEMDHQVCLLSEQEGPSEEGLTQDQSTLGRAGADQAGLIAEGDVSRPEYGLPVVRLRGCPHLVL